VKLKEDFRYWNLYPKNKKDQKLGIRKILNEDSSEPIGQFNTLKVRDWIIFELQDKREDIYP